jgi:hypothetical protein
MTFYGSSQTLTWRFANPQVVNSGTQLQFDVEVQANAAGTYQRDLQVYFNYNTAGFGSNVVANGHITITPMDLMSSYYFVVNTADNTSSKVAVITEATNEMTQPGSATYYNEMPTSYTPLFRVTMDVASNTATAGIDFDAALMNGGQYYQSTSNTNPLKYTDPSLYDNDLSALVLSSLYGTITYADAGSTPLENCTVQVGALGTAQTDASGLYQYTGLSDGPYTLTTTSSLPYTYSTTLADLNVLVSHLLGTSLVGVYYLAGEVSGDGIISLADYNLMVSNLLGLQSGYPAVPGWRFEVQNVTVTGGIGIKSYQGIMSGDTDGSW